MLSHISPPIPTFRVKKASIFTLLFLFALIVNSSLTFAQANSQSLDTGWQYRWGDSLFTAKGIPEWVTKSHEQNKHWHAINFPSNPPNREGKRNVWYRTVLPEGEWRDPVIYIFSIDLIAEVFIDGQQIYHYGTFDENGQGKFEGWPWHMIHLPQDFSGKTIYFRIFSSSSDIGLWGEVKLMEHLDLLKYIVENSITDIVVSGLSLLIALLALIFACVQSNRKTYLLIFFFTFSSSIMLLAQSQVKQFIFNAPLLWDHLGATAYFVLPIAMSLLFGSWCQGKFTKLIAAIWVFHTAFAGLAISGSIMGFVELSDMYFLFDCLLSISLIVLFLIAFSQFKRTHNEIKVLITSFALFSIFLLIDMGVAHNILPWTRMPIAIGLLLFSMTMVAVSLYQFSIVQSELKELNITLEQKVEDRTKELKRLAATDSLTGLMNRRAFYLEAEHIFQKSIRYERDTAILMLDIDLFKQVNDTYGHSAGDKVITAIAACIQKVCRETDLPARFGGEEFVIFLEEADESKALMIAERLRQTISTLTLPNIDKKITASIGVSLLNKRTESLEALISLADKAMYLAKSNGRNNCQLS